MNPFQNPTEVDVDIAREIDDLMDEHLQKTGRIMFFDAMKMTEDAIDAKDVKRSKILSYHITRLLLRTGMPEHERNEIIIGLKNEIEKIEN